MILDLLNKLKLRVSKVLENYKIFLMALPDPDEAEIKNIDNISLDSNIIGETGYTQSQAGEIFPCVIIRPVSLNSGEIIKDLEDYLKINIMLGFYDELNNHENGAIFICQALEKLKNNFEAEPVLNNQYEIDTPIDWELFSDDTRPFSFGEININIIINKNNRIYELNQDYRDGYNF